MKLFTNYIKISLLILFILSTAYSQKQIKKKVLIANKVLGTMTEKTYDHKETGFTYTFPADAEVMPYVAGTKDKQVDGYYFQAAAKDLDGSKLYYFGANCKNPQISFTVDRYNTPDVEKQNIFIMSSITKGILQSLGSKPPEEIEFEKTKVNDVQFNYSGFEASFEKDGEKVVLNWAIYGMAIGQYAYTISCFSMNEADFKKFEDSLNSIKIKKE